MAVIGHPFVPEPFGRDTCDWHGDEGDGRHRRCGYPRHLHMTEAEAVVQSYGEKKQEASATKGAVALGRDLSDATCYSKAVAKGEDTFTVRSQDYTAPSIVCEWVKQNIYTCPADKLREALERAIKMRDWPSRKTAD